MRIILGELQLNILISVNKKYLIGAAVMLKSLSIAVEENITVYLLTGSLSDEDVCDFTTKLNKIGVDVIYIYIYNIVFSDMPVMKFSKEMYYRLIAQYMLPDDMERILYLDADTVILKDISEFYHQSFDDKYMVACRDFAYESEQITELKNRVGILPEYDYFNSGVLLLNLKKLRADISMDFIMNVCKEKKNVIGNPDQDIFNFLYQGKIKYADENIFNYELRGYRRIKKQDEKNIAILHYIAWKPWGIDGVHWNARIWWKYKCALEGGKLKTPLIYYPKLFISYGYHLVRKALKTVRKAQNNLSIAEMSKI